MRIEAFDGNVAGNLGVHFLPQITGDWGQGLSDTDLGEMLWMTEMGRSFPIEEVARSRRSRRSAKANRTTAMTQDLDLYAITQALKVGQNKIRILKLLRRSDWIKILHLLPKELLVNALRLFSKNKLLRLLMMLPKRMLLKMLLRIFNIVELIQKMPTNELMRILRHHKLNNRELVKGLQKMDPSFVLLLLQRIYGTYDYSVLKQPDIWKIFMHTKKERLMEAFKTLPFKALVPFVTGFVKQDPELLMNMSEAFMFKLFDKMTKPTLLQACMVLPNELIIKMLTQLPDQMLLLAAAQIDDKTLEKYLISQHPGLLRMLAGAA